MNGTSSTSRFLLAGFILLALACAQVQAQGNRTSTMSTSITVQAAIAVRVSSTGSTQPYPGQQLSDTRTLSNNVDRDGSNNLRFQGGDHIENVEFFVWALNTTAQVSVPATTTMTKSAKTITIDCALNTSTTVPAWTAQTSNVAIDNTGSTRQSRWLHYRVKPGQTGTSSDEGTYTGSVVITISAT